MRRPNQKIKSKLDAWLGTLIYHAGQGQADPEAYGQRLQSMVAPLMQADTIQDACRVALAQTPSAEEQSDLKREVMDRFTPDRMTHLIESTLSIEEFLARRPITDKGTPGIIDRLLNGWAASTDQDADDFKGRVYPSLDQLVAEWQSKTGCLGTDKMAFRHPKEAGEFMAGLYRLLVEETPEVKLLELVSAEMRTIVDTPVADLQSGLQDILKDGCAFTSWRTCRQLGAALTANPEVKAALSTPEVAALVEYEEQKQGWGDAHQAIELLESSLGAELQEHTKDRDIKTALLNALKSVGRRSLLNNMRDAVKGHLSRRLVEAALRWWLEKQQERRPTLTVKWGNGQDHEGTPRDSPQASIWGKVFQILTGRHQ